MKINSFNPVARAYTDKVSPYRFPQFLTLVHELGLDGTEKVLDIGTGAGVLSMEIANKLHRGGFLQGIDLAPDMVSLARESASLMGRDNVDFRTGDALNLEFENNSFDAVASSNAFPWVPDRTRFLREVHRVLKPGGRLALVALSSNCYREFSKAFKASSKISPSLFPSGKPFELMGARLHTVAQLSGLVEKVGFKVIKGFEFSTEEPIKADAYIERVNAIVNENYFDHLNPNGERSKARAILQNALASRNGTLKVTESSIFVIAQK